MIYIGVIHPKPTAALSAELPPGYPLTLEQLRGVLGLLPNRPITVEHAGVFQAVARVGDTVPTPEAVEQAMRELAQQHTQMSVVGGIIDAWINKNDVTVIAFELSQGLSGVEFLIDKGFLRGLSLTHAESRQPQHESKLVPYEVTLCGEPARPGAWVFYKVGGLISLAQYKRYDVARGIEYTREMPTDVVMEPAEATKVVAASADAAAATVSVTPLEAALAAVSNEEHRKLLADRFSAMVAATDAEKAKAVEAEQRRAELEKKLADQQASSKINQEMLQNQLAMLQANLGQELSSTFHLDPKQTQCAIESEDANLVRNTFERAITAANRRLMQLSADAATGGSRKRKADPEPAVLAPEVVAASEAAVAQQAVAAAAAPEVVAASKPAAMDTSAADATPSDLLSRAMAATFQY